jgi:hypothetical protein
MARKSDRLVTPAVVVAALVVGCLCVLATVGAVTYLSAIGRDPSPMLDLVAKVATAVGTLGTLALQMATKGQTSRVERNTAPLAPGGVPVQLDQVQLATGRLGAHRELPPVPPPTRTAPAPTGS